MIPEWINNDLDKHILAKTNDKNVRDASATSWRYCKGKLN